MIDVYLSQRVRQQRVRIAFYLWQNLPGGTDDEVEAAIRIIKAELAKVDRAVDQLRRLPESGPIKAGPIRKDHNTGLPIHHGLPHHKEFQACNRAQHSRSAETHQVVGIQVRSSLQNPHPVFSVRI